MKDSLVESYDEFRDMYFTRFETYQGCPSFDEYFGVYSKLFMMPKNTYTPDNSAYESLSALFGGFTNDIT